MFKKLISTFETCFEDFRKHNRDCQLFAQLFDLVVKNIPSSFHLKIIEMQVNVNLKHTMKIICLLFTESTCMKITEILEIMRKK